MSGFIAHAETDVHASPEKVWHTITHGASDVSFGATVESDWTPGSQVVWRGEWQGKPFEDRGEVIEAVAPHRLVLTHSSGQAPDADAASSVHRLTYELSPRGGGTHVDFHQDGNATEAAASESQQNWERHLEAVKRTAES